VGHTNFRYKVKINDENTVNYSIISKIFMDRAGLDSLKINQLRQLAARLELVIGGSRAEILDRRIKQIWNNLKAIQEVS